MNITQTSKGENVVSIKINLAKEDYEEKINEALRLQRRKASMPGFRPGMVPMGMIKKMYGLQVKMEVLNELVSENLNKHIIDNNLDLLGYPLSDLDQHTPADLEKQEDMEFWFEAATRPEVKVDLGNIKMDAAKVLASDEEISKTIDNIIERNPNTIHPETVEENDTLELRVSEMEDGKELEDGFKKKEIRMSLSQVKDKASKDMLIGKEVGAGLVFNFAKALDSNSATERLLGEEAPVESDFDIVIDDITREVKPELNEDFFKKVFPNKDITDLDAFRAAVKEEMEKQYEAETDQILFNDMIEKLVAEVKFDLPDTFLKRWIVENSQGKISNDDVEANYESNYAKGLRWQIIEDAIVKENMDLAIKDEELRAFVIKQIFPGIDYASLDDDMKGRLDSIATNMMKNEEQVNAAKNQLADIKMTKFLKEQVQITYKETKYEDFIESLKSKNETK